MVTPAAAVRILESRYMKLRVSTQQMVKLCAICAQKYDSVHAHSAHALHVLRALQYSHFPPAIRTRISLVQGNYVG
jgi:hypothetical protein